jgi:outer membrane lipoprotein-sorting protein
MKKILVMFSLFLLLSLTLTGCGDKITAEEIVAKVQETVENTNDAHGVVKVDVNVQGIEMSMTAEMWEKLPNKFRAEVIDASQDGFAGMTMVSDGQQAWFYDPARNRVMAGPAEEIETPLPQEMLNSLQEVIQEMLDASDVELAGEETVAGYETYKLTLSPKEGSEAEFFPGDGTATLWVDKERWIVLKATYEADTLGQGSIQVQSFELNPGVADDLFYFEVPEGATVVETGTEEPIPLTLDEAKEQSGFPLLLPDYVPEGATLIEVFQVSNGSIVLRYDHSPEVSFTIVQGPELTGPPPLGESQKVTVRDQSATLITDEEGGNTFLYWTENEVTVTIAGHIGLEEALQVVESLK